MNDPNQTFSVTLVNEAKGFKETLQIKKEEYIVDIAEQQGVTLPYSCRSGNCFDCIGKVIEGTVEQSPQAFQFLKRDEIEAGYILTCSAYPTSNCTIATHQEEEFFS